MALQILMCFYFVGAEREERSRRGERGERQRGSTCQWHSELRGSSLMAFCLSNPHHAGVAAAAPSPFLFSVLLSPFPLPSPEAALHAALCLGCEMAQMLLGASFFYRCRWYSVGGQSLRER